jgi:GAF domain-containing protein
MMPDFLFIHEALLSHRNKRFILATGPGALTPRAAIRLLEFCRLISGLQEFQFASGSELLANFSTLAARGTNSQSLEQLLSDLWGWLSQQISLSRLAVILQQGTDSWGQATIIQRRQDGESQLERLDVAIPEHISARLREGERHIVQDIRSGELSDLLAKERYVRHVLSEAYLPLKSPGGIGGIVLFGAPTAGDYLEEEGELLQSVAAYIALWLQLHGLEKAGWTNSEMCSMMRADEV